MSETQSKSNDVFTRGFLPGLVLGLVIGSIASAVLLPMLGRSPGPVKNSGEPHANRSNEDREERPIGPQKGVDQTPEDPQPQDPADPNTDPNTPPDNTPSDPPGGA